MKNGNIFNTCIDINNHILQKYENNIDSSFVEHYLFQATSYVISYIIEEVMVNPSTPSLKKCFLIRQLIENIAVMNMYIRGVITEKNTILLREYNYAAEYKIYKKYKDKLDGKAYDFSQIETNFNNSKLLYKDELINLDDKKITKFMMNQNLPFLLSEYKYDYIIENYYTKNLKFYRKLSIVLHPNALNVSLENDFELYLYLTKQANYIIKDLLYIAKNYYTDYKNIKKFKTLKDLISRILTAPLSKEYLDLVNIESNILNDIKNEIEKEFGKTNKVYLFNEIIKYINGMTYDKLFGFKEVVKCIFKPIIEAIAIDSYYERLNNESNYKESIYLFEIHTRYELLRNNDENSEEAQELLNKAYKLIKDKWRKHIESLESFKNHFNKTLGSIENKNQITQFIYDFIDSLNLDEITTASIKLTYDESQAMSHGNGYLINSNDGAFNDAYSVIGYVDIMISKIIKLYIDNLKKDENKYRELINKLSVYETKFNNLIYLKGKYENLNRNKEIEL